MAGKYNFTEPEFYALKGFSSNSIGGGGEPVLEYSTPDINVPFTSEIKFNKIYTQYTDYTTISSGLTFTVDNSVASVAGSTVQVIIIGDGENNILFDSDFIKSSSSLDYDNTLNRINLIMFLFDGTRYWYSITQNNN